MNFNLPSKQIITIFVLFLLVVPLTSGLLFDNVKQYDKNLETITIKDRFLGIPTTTLATYTLTDNTDGCLIDCYAEGTATLYDSGSLFSDIKFNSRVESDVSLSKSNMYLIVEEDYEVTITDEENVCKDRGNGTSCFIEVTKTHQETRTREVLQEYNYGTLSPGTYKWRIEGKKKPTESIDWIGTAFGEDLTEWAWWNGDFSKRKELTINGGATVLNNFTVPIDITYDSDMQTDFDDIRFINGSCDLVQTLEMDYEWDRKIDSTSALLWLRLDNLPTAGLNVCMYYGNSGAGDGEDEDNAWSPEYAGVWHFSEGAGTTTNDTIGTGDGRGTGTFTGTPTWNVTDFGYGLEFDGTTTERVDIEDNSYIEFLTDDVSIEVIASYYDATARRTIVGSITTDGYNFGSSDPSVDTQMFDNNGNANQADGGDDITLNDLHFFGVSYDQTANEVSLYEDGRVDSLNAIAHTLTFTRADKQFGAVENTNGKFYGMIDEIRIINGTKSDAWMNRVAESLNSSSLSFGAEEENKNIQITLSFPSNNTITTNATYNFNMTMIPIGMNITNATFNLYYTNHTLINSTTNTISTNFTSVSDVPIPIAVMYWTYEACGINSTSGTDCFYPSASNFTLERRAVTEDANFSNLVSYETQSETFQTNVTAASGISVVSSSFIYNGTTHSATVGTISATEYSLTSTIELPIITAGSTTQNHNHHFSFAYLSGGDLVNANTTNGIQRVDFINMSVLSKPNAIAFVNFTVYDQNSLLVINSTFAGTFNYGLNNTLKTLSYEYSLGDFNNFSFGIEPENKTYSATAEIEFGRAGYETQNYDLIETLLRNVTLGMLEVPIYLLESGNSTTFTILVRDSTLTVVEGANVKVQRYYPGTGTYLEVESVTTNAEGKAIGHFIVEDVTYRFLVFVGGVLELTSTPTQIICETTPCTITLTLPSSSGSLTELLSNASDFTSSLVYSKVSQTFTYTYADTGSDPLGGRLHVRRLAGSGDVVACSNNDTSSASVLTCDVSLQTNGTYIATAYLERTSQAGRVVGLLMIQKAKDIVGSLGDDGIIISVFIFMGIVMLGLIKPIIGLLFGVAGLFGIWALGFVSLVPSAFFALIFVALILAWEMRK